MPFQQVGIYENWGQHLRGIHPINSPIGLFSLPLNRRLSVDFEILMHFYLDFDDYLDFTFENVDFA